jgi:hypothetical protein
MDSSDKETAKNQNTDDGVKISQPSLRDKVVKLENYLFEHIQEPDSVAVAASCCVGVAIGLKPSGAFIMSYKELISCDQEELIKIFEDLGLKIVVSLRSIKTNDEPEWYFDLCVAHDFKTARELKQAFELLRDSMDELGQTTDPEDWEVATKKIGHLLGYPETAVESFINMTDKERDSEERVARMRRTRYFAHSAEHEKEECEAYDYVLNRAIDELAPRTTEILKKRTEAGWV